MKNHLLRIDKVLLGSLPRPEGKSSSMGAQGTLDKDLSQAMSDLLSPCLMRMTDS